MESPKACSGRLPWWQRVRWPLTCAPDSPRAALLASLPTHRSHKTIREGRDLERSSNPTPLPKQGHLEQSAWEHIGFGMCSFQRGRLHGLHGHSSANKLLTFSCSGEDFTNTFSRLQTPLPTLMFGNGVKGVCEEELQLMARVKQRLKDVWIVRRGRG